MKKERIVVVCPGRGSYTGDELGYLENYHSNQSSYIESMDNERKKLNQKTITELDNAEKFKPSIHTKGENASVLIHTCAYLDFLSIDQNKYEIVAVTGNSMGWYIALACSGALNEVNGFNLVNTMGSMMSSGNIGGQILYPIMNDQWQIDNEKNRILDEYIFNYNQEDGVEIHDSIYLGGHRVIGANEKGVKKLLNDLPKQKLGRLEYPFQLINHAAFHTPLLEETSKLAFSKINLEMFKDFNIPLVDGRGKIWMPYSTNLNELRDYTLGHQVIEPYIFDKSIEIAMKEFAPDKIVLLGPGGSLGSSIAQILIELKWNQIISKDSFLDSQKHDPILISMGRKDQRTLI